MNIRRLTINLIKYKNIMDSLNRPLNNTELNRYFSITNAKKEISNDELLSQVNNFLIFYDAKNQLILSNLKLVVYYVKIFGRFERQNYMDAILEGNKGLLIATEMYDISFDNKFSTYASYWIQTMIQRFYYQNNKFFTYNKEFINSAFAFKKQLDDKEKELGYHLSIDEIEKTFNIQNNLITQYFTFFDNTMSLDDIIENTNSHFNKLIPSNNDAENIIKNIYNHELLDYLFSNLNEREIYVFSYSFGINNDNTILPQKTIAKNLSISSERVRQIEN